MVILIKLSLAWAQNPETTDGRGDGPGNIGQLKLLKLISDSLH